MCLFRLALGLGLSVTEIEQTFAAREVEEWHEYYAREPWGAWRDNVHAAQICALLFNINRAKGTRRVSYKDFLLTDAQQHKVSARARVVNFFRSIGKPKNGN